MMAHLARYSEAYFRGLLYVLLQYSLAVVGIAAPGPGGYNHLLYFARLSTLALPAILAFMDGSVQRAKGLTVQQWVQRNRGPDLEPDKLTAYEPLAGGPGEEAPLPPPH